MAVPMIAQQEGGDEEAYRCAVRYALKCCRMGGKWVDYNPMTERYEFLYVKRCHITTFTEAWRSFEELEHRGVEPPRDDARGRPPMSAAAASANPSGTAPCAIKPEEKAYVADVPKKKHTTDADAAAGKRSPDQIKEAAVLADTAKLKADFIGTVAAAKQLVLQIETNADWSWARNKETIGRL